MRTTILIVSLIFGIAGTIRADEISKSFQVNRVLIPQGNMTLFSHESFFLGVSCISGPVGEIQGIRELKIGDTIRSDSYSLKVGVIEATLYLKDVFWKGEIKARAGEVECVAAENHGKFPYDDDCDALWARIKPCYVPR